MSREKTCGPNAPYGPNAPRIPREKIYDTIIIARTADKVQLYMDDGRELEGALIFNPFKGTGGVINIDKEYSQDFSAEDIRNLRVLD